MALAGLGFAVWWWSAHPGHSGPSAANPPPKPTDLKRPLLSPPVVALLSTESVSAVQRLNVLATLGIKLSPDDRAALLDSIKNSPPNGVSTSEWHSLANDILQALRNQRPYTPQYTDRLIAFWHDKTLDPTLRDYALQQLRLWVADNDSRTVHEERPEKIALIQTTFLNAATPGHADCDAQSTSTGTALLALDEWAFSKIEPKVAAAPEFQALVLAHAESASCHRGVRATALQICARRGIKEALPIARTVISTASSDAILRMSAISLMGTLGTADDLTRLTAFKEATPDPLLQASLQKAIQNLTTHHSQS